jgi:hypothetical protein
MLKLLSFVCLSFACGAMAAEGGKDNTPVPAPPAVHEARKVFLTNSRARKLAYNTFYTAVETWGRYQIVGSAEEADLVVELAYRVGQGRTWLHDEKYDRRDRTFATTTLTISDARSKRSLWLAVDRRLLAFRQKEADTDAATSAQRLVEEWKLAVKVPG